MYFFFPFERYPDLVFCTVGMIMNWKDLSTFLASGEFGIGIWIWARRLKNFVCEASLAWELALRSFPFPFLLILFLFHNMYYCMYIGPWAPAAQEIFFSFVLLFYSGWEMNEDMVIFFVGSFV